MRGVRGTAGAAPRCPRVQVGAGRREGSVPRGRAPRRDGIGDGFVPRSRPRPCVKCGDGPAAVVIRIGDAFCR